MRTTLILTAALAVSFWMAWSGGPPEWFGFYHDDGLYFVLAKSLAEDGGYRIASAPEPWPMTKYPPLWPALLSLVWKTWPAFPANLSAAVMLTWAALPLWLWISVKSWRREGFSGPAVLAMGLALVLNPYSVMLTQMPMTELAYSASLAAALYLASKDRAWQAGLAGGVSFLFRTAGLPLLASVPFCFLLRKRYREAALFAGTMGAIAAAWTGWSWANLPAGADPATLYYTNYAGFFRLTLANTPLPELMYVNLSYLARAAAELFAVESGHGFLATLLLYVLAAMLAAGALRLWRAGRMRPWIAFGFFLALQLLVYNYPANARFLLPLFPLLLAAAWTEGAHLAQLVRDTYRRSRPGDRPAAAIIGLAASLGLAFLLWTQLNATFTLIPGQKRAAKEQLRTARQAFSWIEANTGRDDAVFSYSDPLVYLYTGRKSLSLRVPPDILWRGDPAQARQFFARLPEVLRRFRLRYVLLLDSDYQRDSPEISRKALAAAVVNAGCRLRAEGEGWKIYETGPLE